MLNLIILVVLGSIATQTDWMGGDGVLGPVSNWVKHIVEEAAGVGRPQGLAPADIDNDGDLDLVTYSDNSAVWYENQGNYTFNKHTIGPLTPYASAPSLAACSCTWPSDLDKDNDIDVLVCSPFQGAGWFENLGTSWQYHCIDSSGDWHYNYHAIRCADVDSDNDIDVVAVNCRTGPQTGDPYLLRNDGIMNFTKELIYNTGTDTAGWRCELSDFNSDGYPDLYLTSGYQYIFINDGTGNFNVVYQDNFGGIDGTWPSDIDMDGDIDIVIGKQWESPHGFFAYKNDGSGNFILDTLIIMSNNYYTDGGVAGDIDLDGLPDIAGVYKRVGYLRQYPLGTFTPYEIDTLSDAHWIYVVSCAKCVPSVDLLVTDNGAHIVYKNRMLLGFASIGYLESSILELTPATMQPCTLKYFGYIACVPNDTALAFCWRAGLDSTDIDTNTWNGAYYAPVGMYVVDSFALSGTGRMFQYKAEFKGDSLDIAVLYEVWVTYCRWTTYSISSSRG